MSTTSFYVQHSLMSDPGPYAALFDAIGDDIPSICQAVQGLIVHYFADGYTPAASTLCELDSRTVSAMLATILQKDERPLTEARSFEKRFVGCCRDFTLLAVSIMRHKGIPARARYGTATYLQEGYYIDHVVLEYWNGTRWVMVDPEMSDAIVEYRQLDFDVHDMPSEVFLTGGQGWLSTRRDGVDSDLFGLGSYQVPVPGAQFVLTELLLDLAALNRHEMLCWDNWGYSTRLEDLTGDDKAFLDKVAEATLDNQRFLEWQSLFQEMGLQLPQTIQSWSPAADPTRLPLTVNWSTTSLV